VNRRQFLRVCGLGALASVVAGTYAVAIEPLYRLRVVRRGFTPPRWTPGLRLRVAVLADIHACEPWMNTPFTAEASMICRGHWRR